jgi:hypothetical protein
MKHESWMGFSRTAMAVAVAVVAAAPALAQNTTSSLAGRVTGADGKPVAGASVTIVHVESGSSTTATTDGEGRYLARGLRVGGPFTVTFSKGGLTEKREGVFLQLAETASLDTTLGAAASGTSTIVITGRGASDKFNSSAMGSGTNLGQRELNGLASIQRNLQDYARTDPRLAQTDKERGEISAGGQNTRFNSVTIDGVTISDTFGLESNNLPTRKQPISIDAIQSVQVNLSNYDATQKGYTGANINAVTKSGTNEFKGSLYYIWRDEGLVGKFYNRATGAYSDFPAFKENTKGFTLGGPIIQDKLFFFGSYEEFKSTKATPSFGPAGSALTNVGIQQSAIDSAISIAKNTWGMDVGSSSVPGELALKVKDSLLKLDWNISDQHRASVRYNKTEQSDPIVTTLFSATQLSLSSFWYLQNKTIETLVGQWFADWTPTFSTEVKVSKRDYAVLQPSVNGQRLPAVGLQFTGALPANATGANTGSRFLNFGTETSRQLNELETKTTDIYVGGNWALGDHELKFGVDYQNNDIYNAFLQNVYGSYTFACENSSATVTYTFGAITCNTATADQVQAAVLENFQRGRPSSYTLQKARDGKTLADGVARFAIGNTGVFVQDSWKVNNTLNLMFGVRLDQQNVNSRPIANAGVAAAKVAGSVNSTTGLTTARDTGGFSLDNTVTLDGNVLAQPRVGFNWNLSGERRMQVRGGFGLFQGAAATVWLSNPFSNTGAATAQYNCASYTACSALGVGFNANPNTQSLTGTIPAAAVDAIDPNLQQPSVWKANLAFETELPWYGLVASAELLLTKTNQGIYYQHLNLGGATRKGSDGRDLYWNREGLDTNCFSVAANGSVSNVTTGTCATPSGQSRNRALSNASFANVILAKGTKMGGGNALTLSIGQPSTQGISWNFAYTRTGATEVSPLTSSTSNSNWNGRNVFNPNEEVLQNSNYLIKDRFSGSLTWSKAFIGSYKTAVGVFYEGRRGKPYSWTYINDMNGDAISGNDLMYIPSAQGSGEVIFRPGTGSTETAAQVEQRFWDVVNANPGLSGAKGGVVGRNNNFAPWVNNFDMRISQELPGFLKSHKATFALDFLNFGNLLNKKWGRIDEIAFPSRRSFVNYAGLDASGKYVYTMGSTTDFVTKQNERESQWAIQATLRYEF